jgi:curved DNA-binding protein
MTNGPSGGDPTLDYLDYYEVLQISPNAEPETIHRVYRLLAQQVHPDNRETGDEERFRLIHQAYLTLSDPEKRARYDLSYHEARNTRWRAVSTAIRGDDEFEIENVVRLTVLEVLYANRRADLNAPGLFILDLEDLTGRAREHLEFTLWYLKQKQYIQQEDNSRVSITVTGVDFLEKNYQEGVKQRRLKASNSES